MKVTAPKIIAGISTAAAVGVTVVYLQTQIDEQKIAESRSIIDEAKQALGLRAQWNEDRTLLIPVPPGAIDDGDPNPSRPLANGAQSGRIPAGFPARPNDAWGVPLGYCRFPMGTRNFDSVAYIVMSAGADKKFDTSCLQAAEGEIQKDDISGFVSYRQMAVQSIPPNEYVELAQRVTSQPLANDEKRNANLEDIFRAIPPRGHVATWGDRSPGLSGQTTPAPQASIPKEGRAEPALPARQPESNQQGDRGNPRTPAATDPRQADGVHQQGQGTRVSAGATQSQAAPAPRPGDARAETATNAPRQTERGTGREGAAQARDHSQQTDSTGQENAHGRKQDDRNGIDVGLSRQPHGSGSEPEQDTAETTGNSQKSESDQGIRGPVSDLKNDACAGPEDKKRDCSEETTRSTSQKALLDSFRKVLAGFMETGGSDGPNEQNGNPEQPWRQVTLTTHEVVSIGRDLTLWTWNIGPNPAPQMLAPGHWISARASQNHVLLIRDDQSLWIYDLTGKQAGPDGSRDNIDENDMKRRFRLIDRDHKWVQVSAGIAHGAAVRSDGSLWMINYRAGSPPVPISEEQDWAYASVGSGFIHAIKQDGSLFAVGSNKHGELGLGDTVPRNELTRVGQETGWIKVDAADDFVVALKNNGSLWVWGRNDRYQLGLGYTNEAPVSSPIPITMADIEKATQGWNDFDVGLATTLPDRLRSPQVMAVARNGTLWGWGDPRLEHIPNNTTKPTLLHDANRWRQAFAGLRIGGGLQTDATAQPPFEPKPSWFTFWVKRLMEALSG